MKHFNNLKKYFRNEETKLPDHLQWESMESNLFPKESEDKTVHGPRTKEKMLILLSLLLVSAVAGYMLLQSNKASNSNSNNGDASVTSSINPLKQSQSVQNITIPSNIGIEGNRPQKEAGQPANYFKEIENNQGAEKGMAKSVDASFEKNNKVINNSNSSSILNNYEVTLAAKILEPKHKEPIETETRNGLNVKSEFFVNIEADNTENHVSHISQSGLQIVSSSNDVTTDSNNKATESQNFSIWAELLPIPYLKKSIDQPKMASIIEPNAASRKDAAKSNANKWGIAYGLGTNYKWSNPQMDTGVWSNQQTIPGVHGYLKLDREINAKWRFRLGVEMDRFNTIIDMTNVTYQERVIEDTIIAYVFYPISGRTETRKGNATVTDTINHMVFYYNSQNVLFIPLNVGYKLASHKNWQMSASGGLAMQLLLRTNGQYLYDDKIVAASKDNSWFGKSPKIGWNAGLQISRSLSKDASIAINAQYMGTFQDWGSIPLTSYKPNSLSLSIGMLHTLK